MRRWYTIPLAIAAAWMLGGGVSGAQSLGVLPPTPLDAPIVKLDGNHAAQPVRLDAKDPAATVSVQDLSMPQKSNVLGQATITLTNLTAQPAKVRVRPVVDGVPHGEHNFVLEIAGGATGVETVGFLCGMMPAGEFTFGLLAEMQGSGAVEIGAREWSVLGVGIIGPE